MDIYDVAGLPEAVRRLERELPGWWWKVGACQASADATIAPMALSPDIALVEAGNEFDGGFDCDIRQPATVAEALNGAIDRALKAKMKQKNGAEPMAETWAEEVARLRREIAERQARLHFLVLGDQARGVLFTSYTQPASPTPVDQDAAAECDVPRTQAAYQPRAMR